MSRPISAPKARTKTAPSQEKVTAPCSPTTPSEQPFTIDDEINLAYAFNDAMLAEFPGRFIPISLQACAHARHLGGYLAQIPPAEQVKVMSEMVEVIFDILRANPVLDILLS